MHNICSLGYERLQMLLRKCQGHLSFSERVWNEDGECVTLRWEVITCFSKAADYVNFTGHSLLGHSIFFYPLCLCDTKRLVMSPEVSGVEMCIKGCDAQEKQINGCCRQWLGVARWHRDEASCAQSNYYNGNVSPGRQSLYLFRGAIMTEYAVGCTSW